MNKSTLISVLCIGIAIGACAREAVRATTPAVAHAAATNGPYHVIAANPMDWDETERNLN